MGYKQPNELWSAVGDDLATYLLQWYTTLCITRITHCKGNTIYGERRNFLRFFSDGSLFRQLIIFFILLFIVVAVLLVKTAFHFFALSSAVFHFTFYSMYSLRDRSSFSSAKVVPGFYGQKGRGGKPFRRQSPHFHFIAGSILAVKPCLS